MLSIYRTDESIIKKMSSFEDGVWVRLVNPTGKELKQVADQYDIEVEDLATALDEEESSRVSLEDGYTLILVDIPSPEVRHEKKMYTTIPMGIILKQNAIITVCREESPVVEYFTRNKVKDFSTKKKMRFIYQLLLRSASLYQAYLRGIDKKRVEIEERAGKDTKDSDIIDLHELESILCHFPSFQQYYSGTFEEIQKN